MNRVDRALGELRVIERRAYTETLDRTAAIGRIERRKGLEIANHARAVVLPPTKPEREARLRAMRTEQYVAEIAIIDMRVAELRRQITDLLEERHGYELCIVTNEAR